MTGMQLPPFPPEPVLTNLSCPQLHDPGSGTKQGKKQYPSHRSSYQNFGIRDTQHAQLSLFFISSVEKSVAFRPFSVSFSVLGKCDKTSIACSPCFVLNDRPQTPTNIDCSPPASTNPTNPRDPR